MIITRLSVMMFLQFFIWGAWFVTAGNFFVAIGWSDHIATVYGLGPIAAMISPLFLGCFADRFFAAQKVLGVLHLIGGGLMFLLPGLALGGDNSASPFVWVFFAYVLLYMPTIALTNAVSFAHLTDQAKQFPLVRVFGTLGWIAAGILVSKILHADTESMPFYICGGASVFLGVYSFFLPSTPPDREKRVSMSEALGLGAIGLLRNPSFLVFIVCSFLVCIPLMAYYIWAPVYVLESRHAEASFWDAAYVMSYGQWIEVFFMLIMPLIFVKWGVKWMLAAGMFAWAVRYGLFAAGDGASPIAWMIWGGILLHGICYDFFFVTGYIYVDKVAPKAIRGQAQGFLILMTIGLGSYVGVEVSDALVTKYTPAEAKVYQEQAGELGNRIKVLREKEDVIIS